jgi:hypothetical protein
MFVLNIKQLKQIQMRTFRLLFIALSVALFLTSCLTVEKKEYKYEFTGKNTGTVTIIYHNICSSNDSDGVASTDFKELIDTYLNGTKPEDEFPGATVIKKEMYEENGKLNARVILGFTDLKTAHLYQADPKGQYMLHMSSFSENYESSNGTWGGEVMPVVFWDRKLKVLNVTTTVEKNIENTLSLLEMYKAWKK